MASSSASKPAPTTRPCTGANYTITASTSGYGSLSNVDALPRQLTAMHLSLFPQTPRQDVTAIHSGFRNDEVFTGSMEARLLKVNIEVRKGAWTLQAKRTLMERVHNLLVQWKGKKAEKTDIVVQMSDIEDWDCVLRNGRWGMWEGAVPDALRGEDGKAKEGSSVGRIGHEGTADDGMSVAESERTLVG